MKIREFISLRKIQECKKGQAMVEFALALPILLLFFGFILDAGRIVDAQVLVQSAANEGIRQVTSKTNINEQVKNSISDYTDRLDFDQLTIEAKAGETKRKNYTYHANKGSRFQELPSYYTYFNATVTLEYDVPVLMPQSKLFFGDEFRVLSTFTSQVFLEGYPEDG